MNKAPVLIILLISLADWSAADSESSFDTIRSIESLEEFAQELNRESRIGRNERPLPRRNTDPARITSGQTLYQNHCLRCHGENARGAPDWYRRDASGNFPPPPLDGSAHAWHHPRAQLVEMIRNGGNIMPPFSTILSADDIDDIIHWFQSFWPDELYQAWARQSEAFEKTNN